MIVIAKYVALGGTWLLVSYVGYIIKNNSGKTNNTKLKVMSCRRQIRRFKRLDEADNNSIF
ncbi:hypothetical protein [Clostridium sulfidigenes]|uniref:hypothetical protein n=1 Tax=Clostridium sulfidigenes TaxID=318464 RepID=UPI003F887438